MPAYRYIGELDPAVYHSLQDSDGRTVTVRPGDVVDLPGEVTVHGLEPVEADPAPVKSKPAKPAATQEA